MNLETAELLYGKEPRPEPVCSRCKTKIGDWGIITKEGKMLCSECNKKRSEVE